MTTNPFPAESKLRELGWAKSFAIYISASVLLFLVTSYLIPFLTTATGREAILFWFITAGLLVFLPLVVLSMVIVNREGLGLDASTWTQRLRFRRLTRSDIAWSLVGLISVGTSSALTMRLLEAIIGTFDHSPPFMSFEPLTPGRYWLLLVWFPYWILNILGEEVLWRGVMLPRQEVAFGKYAWVIHGVGWGVFHVAFGYQLLITLIPLLFIQSYLVQRTKNSWVGVILHGGLNGPSFIAIALGAL